MNDEPKYPHLEAASARQQLVVDTFEKAQVLVIGGAMGGGKTYLSARLSELLIRDPDTRVVYIRKTMPQITAPGCLLDTIKEVYEPLSEELPFKFKSYPLSQYFECGSIIDFRSLRSDGDTDNYRGLQYTMVSVDEATDHTQHSLEFLMKRLRSLSSHPSRMLLTCTAHKGHYLHDMIKGYYLDEDGYPIDERAGDIRYFYKYEDKYYWSDSREDLAVKFNVPESRIISFSYIGLTIFDNPLLRETNPNYLNFLQSLDEDSKARLLYGKW